MRLRDVGDLPAVLTTEQLADLTGVSKDTWWEVARGEAESTIDVTPLRVGRRGVLRWPTAQVLRALGLDPQRGRDDAAAPRPALSVVASDAPSGGGRADGAA